MSDSETSSHPSQISTDEMVTEAESDQDFYVAENILHAYEDEPLARPGEEVNDDRDEDGILAQTLEDRFERRVSVEEW